ncbi:MAG TPA: c-type cytochrome domain-containing protein [Verrucomicrobiae bacterium]
MKRIGFGLAAGALLLAGVPEASAKVDFVKDIQPILVKTCVECHSAEKTKGDLRLDNKEGALHSVKVGKSADSELYKRVILPKDHDDIMPPKGEPLSKAQTDLLKAWIDEGAAWPDGLTLKGGGDASAKAEDVLPDIKPNANELKAYAKLEEQGLAVRQIAMNSQWRSASWHLSKDKVNDQTLAQLKDATVILDLNLAGTKVTDAGLANLKGLNGLRKLHLENTAITDKGLESLKGMSNLRYLNLYNTAITDKGLEQLKGLKNLKNVYVFQTKVTDAGVKSLKAALPGVDINTGAELQVLAKVAEEQKAKAEAEKKEADKKAAEKKAADEAKKKADDAKKAAEKDKKKE